MSPLEVERLLEAAIPAAGRTTLTLTETPSSVDELIRLLERAMVVGNRRGAPLAKIHAPFSEYPSLAASYWHVPIEDSSSEGVVRLSFEKPELPHAA